MKKMLAIALSILMLASLFAMVTTTQASAETVTKRRLLVDMSKAVLNVEGIENNNFNGATVNNGYNANAFGTGAGGINISGSTTANGWG